MANVLIVEDSEEYIKLLRHTMGEHQTSFATHVDTALQMLRNQPIDLVLLDIGLPEKDGFALLAEIQAQQNDREIPIICLTGRDQLSDKVAAFSLGADDYIVKPFDPVELRARVGAKLAKAMSRNRLPSVTKFEGIEIDHNRHHVTIEEHGTRSEVHLTQTEFKLLNCLIKKPDQVFSRDQLLIAAWGENARVLDRVVDVHLSTMRKKLGPFAARIKAVPGLGYKIQSKRSA